MSSPSLFRPLATCLGDRPLVYDCMDDCSGFGTERARLRAVAAEKVLLGRANLVLVSSGRLREVVKARGYVGEPLLVNNALAPYLLDCVAPARQRSASDPFVLLYFGTIGHWFDFESVLRTLGQFPALRVRLAGPAEVAIPSHPRLEHLGTVAHRSLPSLAASSDALFMPFVVNDLIRGVDPVKLYEYICFGRNIIVPEYEEIRRFDRFVHTYHRDHPLEEIVGKLIEDNRTTYSASDARAFLQQHTWSSRASRIVSAMRAI